MAAISFLFIIAFSPISSAAENPFGMQDLNTNSLQVASKDGKCGASHMEKKGGKCGGEMAKKEEKHDDMKKSDGKCGSSMKKSESKCGSSMKKKEGKCGEGKMKMKMKDGKCGEGKCGGNM